MALTTDIRDKDQIRTYNRADSIVFLKTREAFGGLSNMAGGFPLCVNGIHIRTSEALYQACRFPHLPEVQRLIIEQRSPMTAKMKSRKHHQDSRQDWDWIRVKIMRWCLRVKLIQNWDTFSKLLLKTGDQSIVEQSRKDDFWGAKPIDTHTLVGMNALGRLLMGLREEVKTEGQEAFLQVEPLDILDFSLNGRPIEPVTAPDRRAVALNAETPEPLSYSVQPSLFDPSIVKEPSPPEYAGENAKNTGITYFEPYPAYKDSGEEWIGEIPKHWDMLPNRAIFNEVVEQDYPQEQMLSVTIAEGIIRQEALLQDSSKKDSSKLDRSSYKLVQPGDIAYNKMRAWQGAVGMSEYRGIVSPAYVVQRPRQEINSRYLHYLLRTPAFAKEAERWSYGVVSDMWSLRPEHFKMIYTCVPPLPEQAAIVEYLDQATAEIDEAIDKNQSLIGLLKELKQTTIAEAVTKGLNPNVPMRDSGVKWLGEVPAHWEMRRLKHAAVLNPSRIESRSFLVADTTITFLPMERVSSDGQIDPKKTLPASKVWNGFTYFRRDDVLVAKITPCFENGKGAHLHSLPTKIGFGSTEFHVLRAKSFILPQFLYRLTTTSEFRRLGTDSMTGAAGQQRVPTSFIANYPTPLPPYPEQVAIVEHLDKITAEIDEAIDKKQRLIELLKELKQVTIAEAVTGKIKV